jgi:hypothetical protein
VYKTVREYARVARRFELCSRLHNVNFGHYEAVAALPDEAAFRLLKDAEGNDLTVDELRTLVQRDFPLAVRMSRSRQSAATNAKQYCLAASCAMGCVLRDLASAVDGGNHYRRGQRDGEVGHCVNSRRR